MKRKNTTGRTLLNGLALGTILTAGSLHGATSERTTIWLNPEDSLQWKTVMANPSAISLDWPVGATSATFTVAPSVGTAASYDITDTSLRTYELWFDMPTTQSGERMLAMTLTYKDEGGQTVGAPQTARIALVSGVMGNATRCVPSETTAKWNVAECETFVVPVPEDAVRLAVRSQAVEPLDARGWACVKRSPGEASVNLELETAQGTQVSLVKFRKGLLVLVR